MNDNNERRILTFQTAQNNTVNLELLAIYPWEGRE